MPAGMSRRTTGPSGRVGKHMNAQTRRQYGVTVEDHSTSESVAPRRQASTSRGAARRQTLDPTGQDSASGRGTRGLPHLYESFVRRTPAGRPVLLPSVTPAGPTGPDMQALLGPTRTEPGRLSFGRSVTPPRLGGIGSTVLSQSRRCPGRVDPGSSRGTPGSHAQPQWWR